MAFGDAGEHLFHVNGVPFRLSGRDRAAALDKLRDRLQNDPFAFQDRVDRLELDPQDVEAMAQADVSGQTGGQALLDRAVGAGSSFPLSLVDMFRMASGVDRRLDQIGNAGRQIWAESFGDEETVQLMRDIEEREAAIYKKLDDEGIGLEDLGELGPDMAAFMIPGAQGLVGTTIVGGTLGALQVKAAGDLLDRAPDALIGAGAALGFPLATKALGGAFTGIRNFFANRAARVGFRGDNSNWFSFQAFRRKPEAVTDIVDEALVYTVSPSGAPGQAIPRGREIVGEAALEQVSSIVKGLPRQMQGEMARPAALGFLRRTLGEATDQLSNGNVIFNPAKWRAAISANGQRYREMFDDTFSVQMLDSVDTLARAMKDLDNVSPEGARRAAMALIQSPKESTAVLNAMAQATDPAVKRSLFRMLTERAAGAAGRVAGVEAAEATAGALTDAD